MFIRFKNGATWQVLGSDRYDAAVGSPPYGRPKPGPGPVKKRQKKRQPQKANAASFNGIVLAPAVPKIASNPKDQQ